MSSRILQFFDGAHFRLATAPRKTGSEQIGGHGVQRAAISCQQRAHSKFNRQILLPSLARHNTLPCATTTQNTGGSESAVTGSNGAATSSNAAVALEAQSTDSGDVLRTPIHYFAPLPVPAARKSRKQRVAWRTNQSQLTTRTLSNGKVPSDSVTCGGTIIIFRSRPLAREGFVVLRQILAWRESARFPAWRVCAYGESPTLARKRSPACQRLKGDGDAVPSGRPGSKRCSQNLGRGRVVFRGLQIWRGYALNGTWVLFSSRDDGTQRTVFSLPRRMVFGFTGGWETLNQMACARMAKRC